MSVYINGVDGDTLTYQGSGGNMANEITSQGSIGGITECNINSDFMGKIDDVRIYNYARTPKQIVSDTNTGHPSVGSPVGSAIGYWKFDAGYGNVASNSGSAGPSLNARMYNFDSPATYGSGWTLNGKFGKALNFDRADNYTDKFDDSSSHRKRCAMDALCLGKN